MQVCSKLHGELLEDAWLLGEVVSSICLRQIGRTLYMKEQPHTGTALYTCVCVCDLKKQFAAAH